MNERELFNAGYEACLRDQKLQAQLQEVVDEGSLLTEKEIDDAYEGLEQFVGVLKAQDAKTRRYLAQPPSATIDAVLEAVGAELISWNPGIKGAGLEAFKAVVRQRLSLPQPAPLSEQKRVTPAEGAKAWMKIMVPPKSKRPPKSAAQAMLEAEKESHDGKR